MSDDQSVLHLQNRLYAQAGRLAKFGAWECDLATECLTWTDGVYDIFDMPADRPPSRAMTLQLYTDESRCEMEAARAEAIRSGRGFTLDARIRTFGGEQRWMRLSVDVACENGRPVRVFGAKQDVTAEKLAWSRLRRSAERDALTGLANRAAFDARYSQVIGDSLNHGFVSALALIDVDRLKQINDGFGHAAGDECLRRVGARLRHVFRDAALVARVGGDEFAVLLPAPMARSRILQVLRRASTALAKPMLWNGRVLDMSVSVGTAIIGRPHARKLSELFAEADAALYAAKAAGRNTIRVFGEEEDAPAQASRVA